MEDKRYEEMTPGDEAPPGEPSSAEDFCQACDGTGQVDGDQCDSCGGTGRVVRGIGGG